jgi:pyruvate ferredoxin oxidoreductase gamma subunit
MIEIRIHGRGGQGAVTASEILATAAFKDGKFSQAFPKFGPERSGAPVEAYCRIDKKYIDTRTQVYEPDYLIILDDSLINTIDITNGLKKKGMIIINSDKKINIKGFKTISIDATRIALKIFNKPIVNTTILGAFVKATTLVSLKSVEEAIKERFPKEIAEKNITAIRGSCDECKI